MATQPVLAKYKLVKITPMARKQDSGAMALWLRYDRDGEVTDTLCLKICPVGSTAHSIRLHAESLAKYVRPYEEDKAATVEILELKFV
jgi:hypothetical protein